VDTQRAQLVRKPLYNDSIPLTTCRVNPMENSSTFVTKGPMIYEKYIHTYLSIYR
jgi:hypothetical protein